MWTLALLVVIGAIVSFFSADIAQLVKKTMTNPVSRVVVPLIIVSGVLTDYLNPLLSFLLWLQMLFRLTMVHVVELLPDTMITAPVVEITWLFVLSSFFACGLYAVLTFRHKKYALLWASRAYVLMWVFWVILWIA